MNFLLAAGVHGLFANGSMGGFDGVTGGLHNLAPAFAVAGCGRGLRSRKRIAPRSSADRKRRQAIFATRSAREAMSVA